MKGLSEPFKGSADIFMKKEATAFPIDFVIPWVDGSDVRWLTERDKYQAPASAKSDVRFRDWDNLRYWFRGIEENSPWVRKIHFITWGHIPKWLNTGHPKLQIVKHTDYIPQQYLPTFNSHVIELNLHRIPGLSEHFVYFNDDVFLIKRVKTSDFFNDDKPCDTFALNCIFFGFDSAGHIHGNDIEIINSHFEKRQIQKNSRFLWLDPRNGLRNIAKTLLLSPWPWFPGFYYQHLANSYCKSTLEKVWQLEPAVLDQTCQCRFRQNTNVNQWIFKFWQLAEGNFYPRSNTFGHCYHLKDSNYSEACSNIIKSRYSMICLNDTARTTDFENKKEGIMRAFQNRFPQKSSFEL